MDPTVEKYLDDLRIQRQEVEKRLKDREQKKKESDEIFLNSVKKELEFLEKSKMNYELRNKKFLEDAKDTIEGYKAELAKAYQADQVLNVCRRKLDKFIQKNYPKIVNELKARLFRDHDDVSRKLKAIRDGGSDVIRLNKEIKDLSEEIQAKRYELLEEEERRLRNEGSLKNYMYVSNPYSRNYDVSNISKRLPSPGPGNNHSRMDVSRSKPEVSVSPPRDIGRGTTHSDAPQEIRKATALKDTHSHVKPNSREKESPHSRVSFGQPVTTPEQQHHHNHNHYSPDPHDQRLRESQRPSEQPHSHSVGSSAEKVKGSLKIPEQIQKLSPKRHEDDDWDNDVEFSAPKGGGSKFGQPHSHSGGAPTSSFGLKIPVKGETNSGAGPERGLQKLNLGKVGGTDKHHHHGGQKDYFTNEDMEDMGDFEF